MSAIFGIVHTNGRPVDLASVEAMNNVLAPYGPDGGGTWFGANVALGQRLMRFTPEDCFERQPLISRSGQHVLVADARIDNRPELAGELGISDPEAREMPDSAFILRAYEKWGQDCPCRLIGAFTFALADLHEGHVLLARSPMGERSLFYYEGTGIFAFSSAPKGLFALPSVPRALDEQSIADYLMWIPPDPGHSLFAQINILQAGQMLVIRPGESRARFFWSPRLRREIRFSRDQEYVEAFNALFERVVSDYSRSATPVGVSMSGGLDSTAIAAVASSLLAKKGTRLQSFTSIPPAGFKGSVRQGWYADETPFVEAIARNDTNLVPHFIRANGGFFLDGLDHFFNAADAPYRNTANRGWMEAILAAAAENDTRVLLTGMVGNLTISWDGSGLLPCLLRTGKWARAFQESRALAEDGGSALRVLARSGILPFLPGWLWRVIMASASNADIAFRGVPWRRYSPVHPDFARANRAEERAREKNHDFFFRPCSDSRLHRYRSVGRSDLYLDIYRGHESMFGVSKRIPAGDLRIVEFCLALPEEQFLRRGKPRWLIRRSMTGRLPPQIIDKEARGAQSPGWFDNMVFAREQISDEMRMLSASETATHVLDLERMRALAEHLGDQEVKGTSLNADQKFRDYHNILSVGVMMGRFLRWFEGGNSF